MKIVVIVGTRPNFIKVTQFRRVAAALPGMELKIVHTGQHYDGKMADVFFEQFGLTPDFFLEIPPSSPNTQMAEIMLRLEKVFTEYQPDMVLVVGDVNSTMAASITANKMGIRIGHIESGLRSNDRTMPEEFNRIVTDQLADVLFVTEQSGLDNLQREENKAEIHFVGNTMIDTLVHFSEQIEQSDVLQKLSLQETPFILMTMHRPSNVDSKEGLELLQQLLKKLTAKYAVVFPVHPRTVKCMKQFGLHEAFTADPKLIMTEPLDYFGFQKLVRHSAFVLTDSGGIQEETTFLQVPCLTLRPNTERPVTVDLGSNTLLPFNVELIMEYVESIGNGTYKKGKVPPLWDGKASDRIFEIIHRSA
jgi:UDP-N-acetylglucosamine 2-epimerase (non-hydrolysing)